MRSRLVAAALLACLCAPIAALHSQRRAPQTLATFDDTVGWRAIPSDGVRLSLRSDRGVVRDALRMERREVRVLRQLGIANPYRATSGGSHGQG